MSTSALHRLVSADARLSEALRLPGDAERWRGMTTALAHVGDGWLWILAWAIAYLLGDEVFRSGILRWVAAALAAGGIVAGVKFLLPRQRPTDVSGFYSRRHDLHSFPSGHAARMGVAAFMGPLLSPVWGWALPPLALLVAWARVALGVHYLLDVIVGLTIGILSALFLHWLL